MLRPKLVLLLMDILQNLVLKKHDVFYTSVILEVTWYEPLYNIYIYKLATVMWATRRFLFKTLRHRGVREGTTPFHRLLNSTFDLYLIMPIVKQGCIKYDFFNIWYDSTWDWTPVSRAIGEPAIITLCTFFFSDTEKSWVNIYLQSMIFLTHSHACVCTNYLYLGVL